MFGSRVYSTHVHAVVFSRTANNSICICLFVYVSAMYILVLVYFSPYSTLFVVVFSFYLACNYVSGAHNWLISYSIDQTQRTPLLHTKNSSVSVQLNVLLSSYMSNINKPALAKLNLVFLVVWIFFFGGDFIRTTNHFGVDNASFMRWFFSFDWAELLEINFEKSSIFLSISELCELNQSDNFQIWKSWKICFVWVFDCSSIEKTLELKNYVQQAVID